MIVQRWLLAWFILLFPFYLFRSGVPQLSHAGLALACVLAARPLVAMLRTPDREVLLPLLLFSVYAALVNGYHSLTTPTTIGGLPLVRSAYIFFNYGVFAVFLLSLRDGGVRDLRFFLACVVGSVMTLAVVSMVYPVEIDGRLMAFFNNPNQLGYYALTMLAAGLAYSARGGLSIPLTAVFIASCTYLIARSLSVAAMAALVVLWILAGSRALSARRPLAMALALSLIPLAALTWFTQGEAISAAFERRSERLEYLLVNFARDRYLTWFVTHPEHLMLGAGEGAAERFLVDQDVSGAEVHSTLGTLLFAYGLPGTALFLLFLWRIVRVDPTYTLPLLVPLFIYGLAHNGLRFSILWFCLVVIYYTARLPAGLESMPRVALWPPRAGPAPPRGRTDEST